MYEYHSLKFHMTRKIKLFLNKLHFFASSITDFPQNKLAALFMSKTHRLLCLCLFASVLHPIDSEVM